MFNFNGPLHIFLPFRYERFSEIFFFMGNTGSVILKMIKKISFEWVFRIRVISSRVLRNKLSINIILHFFK